jgi:hypothetical protein
LLQRLLNQQVTLEEARYIARHLPSFAALTDKLLHGGPSVSRTGGLDAAALEETFKSAIDFYIVALMRDKPLADNTLALARRQPGGRKMVPLVAGGFHTAGLIRDFKKAGAGYIVITPQITAEPAPEYHALYEKRLSGERLSEQDLANDLHIDAATLQEERASVDPDSQAVRVLSSLFSPSNRLWSLAAYHALKERHPDFTQEQAIARVARAGRLRFGASRRTFADYLDGILLAPTREMHVFRSLGFGRFHNDHVGVRTAGHIAVLALPSLMVYALYSLSGVPWLPLFAAANIASLTFWRNPVSDAYLHFAHALWNMLMPRK